MIQDEVYIGLVCFQLMFIHIQTSKDVLCLDVVANDLLVVLSECLLFTKIANDCT